MTEVTQPPCYQQPLGYTMNDYPDMSGYQLPINYDENNYYYTDEIAENQMYSSQSNEYIQNNQSSQMIENNQI
ncbi:MAG: hypothetical protein J6I95_00045, partial [Anaerotignum sp.]|nr:hypothetical protein [Anaerotignum sp.]